MHQLNGGLKGFLKMVAIASAALFVTGAQAAWPDRPIKIVVTFASGGASDIVARVIADPLSKKLGQAVIVENKPGAGGSIGGAAVATAAPDGYTLMLSNSTPISIGPFVLEKLPYDPIKAFTHVFYIGSAPCIILANPKANALTMADLAKLSKPGPLNFGSGGPASIGHIVGELIKMELGSNMVHVPYRGGAPMTTDLIGGQIPIGIDVITAYTQYVKAGSLKAVAVTSAKRSSLLPDVPTVSELGYPKLTSENFFGVSAPAGLPKEISDVLHKALSEVLTQPDVIQRLDDLGVARGSMNPAGFTDFVSKQVRDWAPAIKASGAKL